MKAYRGGLPVPDNLGRWRPVVGKQPNGKPQRFHVGSKRDTTETQATARLNAIRDLYDHQCQESGIDYWATWALPWAQQMGRGIPVRWYGTRYALENPGEAAEQISRVNKLQSWGLPVEIATPELMTSGQAFIRQQIEEEVTRAIQKVMAGMGSTWGTPTVEKVQEALPSNWLTAEQRGLHDALDAYAEHLRATKKMTVSLRHNIQQLKNLKRHHENLTLWKLDLPEIQRMAAYWRNRL